MTVRYVLSARLALAKLEMPTNMTGTRARPDTGKGNAGAPCSDDMVLMQSVPDAIMGNWLQLSCLKADRFSCSF